jgi:hypothetical protein
MTILITVVVPAKQLSKPQQIPVFFSEKRIRDASDIRPDNPAFFKI